MRCTKHYTDLTSLAGVCASCLRERLFSIIAAQEQAQVQTLEESNRNSDTHPVFPRSVSPYICRRKSDDSAAPRNNRQNSDRSRHQSLLDPRFFSTPQVGPTIGGYNPYRKKKHGFIRFSFFANLFRSKKRNGADLDPRVSVSIPNFRESSRGTTSVMSSPSWLSNIRSGGGSRKKQPLYFDESSTTSGAGAARKPHCRNRGMSPVRHSDDCGAGEDDFYDGSSGYESCESRKQTPWRTPAHSSVRRAGAGGQGKNVSGLTFCLSPLGAS